MRHNHNAFDGRICVDVDLSSPGGVVELACWHVIARE